VSLQFFLFGVLAIFAIGSGIFVISHKSPVASALGLVFHFFMLAGLYLTLSAQFLAVVQVMVYAGAIMVLFIFVIMLLNLTERAKYIYFKFRHSIAILLSAVFLVQVVVLFLLFSSGKTQLSDNVFAQGTVESLGAELYTNYILPVISIAVLLTASIIGAVVLAKRKLEEPKG
jgi:NADH-quinone oxidoreductase subunit J